MTSGVLPVRAEREHTYTRAHVEGSCCSTLPSARLFADTYIQPKPQVLLGPVLDTDEKGINYICKDTGILQGNLLYCPGEKKISKWWGRGGKRKNKMK